MALAAGLLSCEREPEWVRFTSPEGRFAVSMPSKPRPATQIANSPAGRVKVFFFETKVDDGDVVYSVTYTDYPFENVGPQRAEELLKESQGRAVADVSGEVLREKKTSYQGYPARETGIRAATGTEYWMLVVLAGARLYQVFTVSRPGALPVELRTKFFDSFEIAKQ